MDNNENIKTNEDTRKNKKNKSGIIVVLLIIAITAAVVLTAYLLSSPMNSEKVDDGAENEIETSETAVIEDDSEMSGKKAKGFPVSFLNNTIKDIKPCKSGVFVLTNDMVSCISKTGNQIYNQPLSYGSPVIKTNGDSAIVYDKLSGKYTIFTGKKMLFQKKTENEHHIITANINSDGVYAISSRNDDSASLVSLYKSNGERLYAWACAKEHVVSLDVSSNGKNILCAAIDAKDGEILTKVYLLDISMEQVKWETTLEATAAIDCFFMSQSKAVVVCNDRRIVLSLKGNKENVECSFSNGILLYDSDSVGNSAVVTSKFGSFDSFDITFYNANNAVMGSCTTDKKIIDIECVGKKAYLLTQDSIIVATASGQLVKKLNLDIIESGMAVSGMTLYHFSNSYLFKN